jgi:hypothetical protein
MRHRLVLGAVLLSVGCGAKSDLEKLCTLAGEVAADPAIALEQRELEMARRAEAEIGSEKVRNIVKAMLSSAQEHKVATLKKGAEEVGVDDYRCPALEDML